MSGFIEFCVELKSASEGGAAAEADTEADSEGSISQRPTEQEGGTKNGRGGRRVKLQRQGSVVCSRVHSLNTISYVSNGEFVQEQPQANQISVFNFLSRFSGKEIKRLKPKRAASFFTRQASAPSYSAVQVTDSQEQG